MMQGAPPQMMPPGPMGMGMGPAPMQGMAGPMTPMQQGMGYDQYLPLRKRKLMAYLPQVPRQVPRKRKQMAYLPQVSRKLMSPMYRMPAPPPRFPTPGRMDGTRDYPGRQRGMMMPLEGI